MIGKDKKRITISLKHDVIKMLDDISRKGASKSMLIEMAILYYIHAIASHEKEANNYLQEDKEEI